MIELRRVYDVWDQSLDDPRVRLDSSDQRVTGARDAQQDVRTMCGMILQLSQPESQQRATGRARIQGTNKASTHLRAAALLQKNVSLSSRALAKEKQRSIFTIRVTHTKYL